ncbi:tetratricopeptide repeat protein [Candidatus Dependentiae bacterium]|nr:tetratricopeptide repeat protein [Candidatus Dependentiae bacterium]
MVCKPKFTFSLIFLICTTILSFSLPVKEFNKIRNELFHLSSIQRHSEIILRVDILLEEKLTDFQKTTLLFYRGQAYLKKGSLDSAINDFEELLKLKQTSNHRYIQAVNILLDLLFKTGEEKRLRKNLDMLVKLKIKNNKLNKLMADYYMLIGDPISAYNIYEGFLSNKRMNVDNYLKDLVRSAIKGKVEDKLEKKLIEESKKDERHKLILAKYYYWGNKYNKAEKIVMQLKKTYPSKKNYKIFLGEIYWASGNKNKAYAEWENIYLENPDDFRNVLVLAKLYEKYGLLDEAYQKYKIHSDRFPSNLNSLLSAANILHLQEKFREEIDLYFERLTAGRFTDYSSTTRINLKLQDLLWEEDLRELIITRFAKIKKNKANFHINLIELSILIKSDKYNDSRRLALKLIEINKNDFSKVNRFILSKLRTEKGKVILKFVLEDLIKKNIFPYKKKQFQIELARTLYDLGEYRNAIEVYKSNPDFMKHCKNRMKLANIYLCDLGDLNNAKKIIANCPESRTIHYIYGIINLINNNTTDAIRDLEESNGTQQKLWLGMAYVLKGDKESAIKNFDEYIIRNPDSDIAGDVLSISRQIESNIFNEKKAEDLFINLFISYNFKQFDKVNEILLELENYKTSSYYSEGMIIKSRKLRVEGEFDEAIKLLKEIPDIYYRKDYTLYLIAEIYRLDKKNPVTANKYYQKLIMTYPKSIWAGRARKIIELLNREGQT